MLSLKDLNIVGRTYRNINRYRQILTILFKYGFGNIIDVLKIDQYLEIGLKVISRTRPERVEKLSPAQRVRLLFEELGPTFIKFGQILSTRPDLIPVHYLFELEKLQDDVPPFSFDEVRQIIADELGAKASPFESIEEHPLASASLGQVHAARLNSGQKVAVKIQRPGIQQLVKIDLEIMQHLATLMERHIEDLSYFRPVKIVEEFAASLERELDYTLEASSMERVAKQFALDPTIYIPQVFLTCSTTKVLTMEYIQGIKISDIDQLDEAGIDRKQLTIHGADMVLTQVFEYGFFHADLHPGNLFVLPGNVLCPVDYGMMGFIDIKARNSFIDLITSVVTRNSAQACRFLLELTEYDREPDMRLLERDLAQFTGHYLSKPLKHLNVGRLFQDLLRIIVQHQLRLYPDTFLMMKSFAALEGVAHSLDPEFDMTAYAAPFLKKMKMARLSPKKMKEDLGRAALESLEFLQEVPTESLSIIRQIRQGRFVLGYDIQRLEKILTAHGNAFSKLSFAIIIAALIMGSSILLSTKAPPEMFGLSLPGLVGFGISILLTLWLFGRTKS